MEARRRPRVPALRHAPDQVDDAGDIIIVVNVEVRGFENLEVKRPVLYLVAPEILGFEAQGMARQNEEPDGEPCNGKSPAHRLFRLFIQPQAARRERTRSGLWRTSVLAHQFDQEEYEAAPD